MMHFLTRLEKSKTFWYLLGFSVLFFFLRLPSLIEPYWYGDEGIYQTIGLAMQEGRLLYQDIWDNKTPLLYTLYGLFGPEQPTMRTLSLIFGLISIPFFFFLAKNLMQKEKAALLGTFLYVLLLGLPFLEGNIANAENFMLLPIVASAFIFSLHLPSVSNRSTLSRPLFFTGLFLGIAFLFKTVAIFDFTAFLLFYLFITLPKRFSLSVLSNYFIEQKKNLGLFLGGFLLPFLLSVVFFLIQGGLNDYIHAAFFGNVDYVGVGNSTVIFLFKFLLLLITVFFLFKNRTRFSSSLLFISLWLVFSLFNSFFSHRPYTHYLLVLIPSFSLFTGYMNLENTKKRYIMSGIILGITLVTLTFFTYWSIAKTALYYTNYLSYLTGNTSFQTYASFFDQRTPRDHDIATYMLPLLQEDKQVFYWGDNAQMYYLTRSLPPGKYTAAYHIVSSEDSLQETREAFERVRPHYVVLFPAAAPFPYPMYNYEQRLSIQGAIIYERIY